jgi:molybdenum cofactor synthesis domain-containing protein
MLPRFSQLTRHLSRPLPHLTTRSSAAAALTTSNTMTSPSKTSRSPTSKIHTAACLIIGDEVLGGKTVDTNSAFMAKYCFSLGMSMKRVEVIADDEDEIIEACTRMSKNYDFVVTSGGIGPTHDDITYASIAKAFGLELKLHDKTMEKMRRLSRPHKSQPNFDWDTPSPALKAKMRMAELPWDPKKAEEEQVLFPNDALWVPISVVNNNIHILPGVPRLFEALLNSLRPLLVPRLEDPDGKGTYRMMFSTPLAESSVAGYLTELAEKVGPKGVKVGSYPRWGKKRNVVTLVGSDREYMDSLEEEVAKGVEGRRVQVEGEDDSDKEEDIKKDKDA